MADLLSESYKNEEMLLDTPFCAEEVPAAVRKLKSGKAAGPDGLLAEHLKWGGESVLLWLQGVLNFIVESEAVPSVLKTGILVPVYKGGGKDIDGQFPRSDFNINTRESPRVSHRGPTTTILAGGWAPTCQPVSIPEGDLLRRGDFCNTGNDSTVHAWWQQGIHVSV